MPTSAPCGTLAGMMDARAQTLIDLLQLKPLPGESGYLAVIGKTAQTMTVDDRSLALQSQNYYLLTRGLPINYLHWLASHDTHILIEGGPVDYYIFHPGGRAEKQTLGMNLFAGERPVVAVPADCWKALCLHDGAGYALMANTLSPEWTLDRVKIGAGDPWLRHYEGNASWATEPFLRHLIGPNFHPGQPSNLA
jgi:predicted cupin superfamily sugar epimerase